MEASTRRVWRTYRGGNNMCCGWHRAPSREKVAPGRTAPMMDARFSTARQFYRIEGDQPPMQNLATGQPENLRSGNVSTWRMGQWGPHGFCRVLMSASGQLLTLRARRRRPKPDAPCAREPISGLLTAGADTAAMVLTPEQHSQIATAYEKAAADEMVPPPHREAFARKADWFRLLARIAAKKAAVAPRGRLQREPNK